MERENRTQKRIGYRVKAARESRAWTQERLTEELGLNDRQSVSDIENGKRALRPEELVRVAALLGRDLEYFIDPFALEGEAQFSWRASPTVAEETLAGFELQAGGWIGLLRWLREGEQGRANPLKQSLRLSSRSSFEDAQDRAESLVRTLELGLVPAERLSEQIEKELDIPVLFFDRPAAREGESISGATCHLPELGVILVERNESEARRNYDLAHELFHALTWDAMTPGRRESNALSQRSGGKRIEHLADNFAAALLMPLASLEHFLSPDSSNDTRHLAEVAEKLRVSPVALAWRLYNLKRIGKETCEALKKQRQRAPFTHRPKLFSPTFAGMLHRAIDQGRLSSRKAARTLGLSLPSLAGLFAEHGLEAPFEL